MRTLSAKVSKVGVRASIVQEISQVDVLSKSNLAI